MFFVCDNHGFDFLMSCKSPILQISRGLVCFADCLIVAVIVEVFLMRVSYFCFFDIVGLY